MDYMIFQPILDIASRAMFIMFGITAIGVIVGELSILIRRLR